MMNSNAVFVQAFFPLVAYPKKNPGKYQDNHRNIEYTGIIRNSPGKNADGEIRINNHGERKYIGKIEKQRNKRVLQ